MIKAILYERTVAVCASMDFGKVWEDLSLEMTAGGLDGGRRLWRQESVFKTFRKNTRKIFCTRSQRIEIWIEQHRWIRAYGISRVRLCTIWMARFRTVSRLSGCVFVSERANNYCFIKLFVYRLPCQPQYNKVLKVSTTYSITTSNKRHSNSTVSYHTRINRPSHRLHVAQQRQSAAAVRGISNLCCR